MAARWGTGEEIISACNMEYFSTASLEEAEILQDGQCGLQHHGLDAGDTLEALQSCLDPSILSIFEDSPPGGVKMAVNEESEATLLTALTEILDNVDDENLSPFDTLPDAELLQGQKGHEHQALRKFLSLSRSPPEKEAVFSSRKFPGKTCSAEEDGSSVLMQDLDASLLDELDWCLPVLLEQDGESVPVSLSELVKHMHPCSMTVCVEGQEQLLPEGGIVLEVVDNGEHGEPILAIPDLNIPLSLPGRDTTDGEQTVPENVPEKANSEPEVTSEEEALSSEVVLTRNENTENAVIKLSKKESSKKCPSKRKKKRKTEEVLPAEGRLLRSASSKKLEEPINILQEEHKKKKKVTFALVPTVAQPEMCKVENSSEVNMTDVQSAKESSSSALITTSPTTSHVPPCDTSAKIIESKPLPVPEDQLSPVSLPLEEYREDTSSKEEPTVSQPSEPKPKSLSLQEYRRLRQHKKPSPPEKTGDNSTKWPSLMEAPRELPPIPCLPDPSPRDPRCAASSFAKKEPVPEIMPAWQPRGPTAPPTPEALLVPPASMLTSSRKPEHTKSVPPPTSKLTENVATSTNPLVQPNNQKLPISTDKPQNTISNKVSAAAKSPVSLPVATTNEAPRSLHATGLAMCLQDSSSTSDQVIPSALSSKIQDISKSQAMTEITTRTTTNVQTLNVPRNKPNDAVPLKKVAEQAVGSTVPEPAKPILPVNTTRPTMGSQRHVAPIAAQPFTSAPIQARIVKLAEQMRMASAPVSKAKSPTAELVESFTSEIGIEAADLTSLLEQFEETQPKEEKSLPEVCGRAAAVGNSSVEQQAETKALGKASSPDLCSTAGLTPPATPPHQMWKPLAPVALLAKPKTSEVPKPTLSKAIQIEPRPISTVKSNSRPQASITLGPTQPFSLDHDYCLLPNEASQKELCNRFNIKQQSNIIIKSIQLPSDCKAPWQQNSQNSAAENFQKNLKASQPPCEQKSKKEPLTNPIMTPESSPDRMDSKCSLQDEEGNRHHKFQGYSEHSSNSYHQKRGRSQRTYRTRLCSSSGSRSSSSESSRSRSPSPSRKRYRSGRSRSSSRSPSGYRSCSRSCSRSLTPPRRRRYSYSSSCSGSWSRSQSRSQSRSRSRSPAQRYQQCNSDHSPSQRAKYHYYSRDHKEDTRKCKEKAIEERRVVYVGRIHGAMTRKELRERFSYFGEIEDCTVHFREKGDNYGFVTYYNTKDAFNAIENGSRLRQPNELPFDLCFGGRRQFCRSSYADLDSNQNYDPAPARPRIDALDFDTLLKQAQRNLKR